MVKYIFNRIIQCLLCLFAVITIVFCLLRLMPESGYFADNYNKLDREQIDAVLTKYNLDKPVIQQLGLFYKGLFKGDLGKSIKLRKGVSVLKIIGEKAPYSIKFGLAAILIQYLIGIPLGVLSASYKNKWPDKVVNLYIILMRGIPELVLLTLVQIYLSKIFNLPLLYKKGVMLSCIMPVICLSLRGIAINATWVRRFMVDELNKDYIRLARAKGLKKNTIMFKHVFKNSFLPLAQYIPVEILYTVMGTVIVEGLFSIPGMGGLMINSIIMQDNFLIQALVIMFSSFGIFGLLLGDLLLAALDPRIKLNRKEGAR